MLKIRRSRDRLIFNIGIPIPGKDGLDIDTGPWSHQVWCVAVFARCTGPMRLHENPEMWRPVCFLLIFFYFPFFSFYSLFIEIKCVPYIILDI